MIETSDLALILTCIFNQDSKGDMATTINEIADHYDVEIINFGNNDDLKELTKLRVLDRV